jgi:hypothetical protein
VPATVPRLRRALLHQIPGGQACGIGNRLDGYRGPECGRAAQAQCDLVVAHEDDVRVQPAATFEYRHVVDADRPAADRDQVVAPGADRVGVGEPGVGGEGAPRLADLVGVELVGVVLGASSLSTSYVSASSDAPGSLPLTPCVISVKPDQQGVYNRNQIVGGAMPVV